MIIISDYRVYHKAETIYIRSTGPLYCPYEQEQVELFPRGTCFRYAIRHFEKKRYNLSVLECPSCHRTHRVLPDYMIPYRQYCVEDVCTMQEEPMDHLCTEPSTVYRIRKWLALFFLFVRDMRAFLEMPAARELSGYPLAEQLREAVLFTVRNARWKDVQHYFAADTG